MLDCDCPRCGSRNTKALSVLHTDGARDSSYRRDGWFYFRRSFGVHRSTTRGRSQTLTSQMAAPPVPSVTRFLQGGGVPVTLLVGMFLGGAPGFYVALAALIWIAIASGRDADRSHARHLQDWASTFRCPRCGTVFAVIEGDPRHAEHS
jgi:hypothetical protein